MSTDFEAFFCAWRGRSRGAAGVEGEEGGAEVEEKGWEEGWPGGDVSGQRVVEEPSCLLLLASYINRPLRYVFGKSTSDSYCNDRRTRRQ